MGSSHYLAKAVGMYVELRFHANDGETELLIFTKSDWPYSYRFVHTMYWQGRDYLWVTLFP